MKLKSIQVKNYRSIEDISFEINELEDKSFTFGLMGVNEAGKSSILKALALKEEGLITVSHKDFIDKKPIEISYFYESDSTDISEYQNHLNSLDPAIESSNIDLSQIILKVSLDYANPDQRIYSLEITKFSGEEKDNIQEQLKQLVLNKSHKSIFWTAEDKYLISQPINLSEFATNHELSIPLKNCFMLAGITEIQDRVNNLVGDSTEIEQLQTELGEKVTKHINTVWSKHPIEITFLISDGLINFHVKDKNVKSKAKTADQRSDGFRQFVSFLLTISAQDRNNQLSNSILLLDEPETHLHPQAQESLLNELVKITQNERNNVVFFATHSNYMIDKNDLSRNYRVKKPSDKTEIEKFDKKVSTYASVTYDVFEISSTDYHNQLYDSLRESYTKNINKDDVGILEFDSGFFQQQKKQKASYAFKGKKNKATLPTYVRNAIHYPENKDQQFDKNLEESIKLLKSYEN